MKRVIYALLMAIVGLCLIYGCIDIAKGLLSGTISLAGWLRDHELILAFIVCYIGLNFVGPFKKTKE